MEILHIENLSFRYPNSEIYAINDINLNINSGEFVVVCGESGCGKTTLLKLLKRELAPIGEKSGKIFYCGVEQEKLENQISSCEIGYVLQNPDNQIVTDKVWHELAFGLENMGVPTETIRRRVGEMASYFGINEWFRKKTDELSGGQKQLLNLAAIMVMQPKILILDEPTSQLDPIAASDFIATLQKINRELGLTIILVEHRLEEVFPIADKVLILDGGRSMCFASPREVGQLLCEENNQHNMILGLPTAVRIYKALDIKDECPLTVKEGRAFLERHFGGVSDNYIPQRPEERTDIAIKLENVWFRYEKALPDVLRGADLKIYNGECFCLLGGNGTGKTTTLNVISGLNRAWRGKVLINGKSIKDYKGNSLYRNNLAYLPQNPQTVFVKDNIYDDFVELMLNIGVKKLDCDIMIKDVCDRLKITHLINKHPYDLSGGEQQKCALAKMLLLNPRILLLDEPTKGLDAYSKKVLSDILMDLKTWGVTLVIVTHDVEFAAENADRCALFFDGEILSSDVPSNFFAENNFYTTAANRMARQLWHYAVTAEQVIQHCLAIKEK